MIDLYLENLQCFRCQTGDTNLIYLETYQKAPDSKFTVDEMKNLAKYLLALCNEIEKK